MRWWPICAPSRRRSECSRSLAPRTQLLLLPSLADRLIEVHGREIVGEQFAALGRLLVLGTACEQSRKGEAKAVPILQRACALRQHCAVGGLSRRHHGDFAFSRGIEMEAAKHRTEREQ